MTADPGQSDNPRGSGLVMCLFIVLFGLVVTLPFVSMGTWRVGRTLAGLTWPQQPAELLDARIIHEHNSESDNYYVDVRYAYAVDGTVRESGRWAPAIGRWDWGSRSTAEHALQWLRSQPLTVRVNPYNRGDAAIFVRLDSMSVVLFAWGWGFFLVFVVAIGSAFAAQALDTRAAVASPEPDGRLPRCWRRLGVRDDGDTLHLVLPRRYAAAIAFPMGLALVGAGLTGFLTAFSPVPEGIWQWVIIAAAPIAALHGVRDKLAQTHCTLDARERMLSVGSTPRALSQARFSELAGPELMTSRNPDRPSDRRQHLVFRRRGEHLAPVAVLDLDGWPQPAVQSLIRRIERLTGLASCFTPDGAIASAAPAVPGIPLQPYRKTVQSLWGQLFYLLFGSVFVAGAGTSLVRLLPWLGREGSSSLWMFLAGASVALLFGLTMAGGALWEAAFILRLGQPRASLQPAAPRWDEPFRFAFELLFRGTQRMRSVNTVLVLREQFETKDHEGSTQVRHVDRLVQQHPGSSPLEISAHGVTVDVRFRIPADGLTRYRSGDHPYLWVVKVLLDFGRGDLYTYDYLLPLEDKPATETSPFTGSAEPYYDVLLIEPGPGLMKFPRAVQKAMPFLNLAQTSELLVVTPTLLRTGADRGEAEKLRRAIEAAGGRVLIQERS